MFNMLYQYSQVASTRRSAQVWLPGDTAPTTEWFPFATPIVANDSESLARWEDDGGRP